jgi:hypothetical protein
MSRIGLRVAGVYLVVASCVAIEGVRSSSSGGWISMKTMLTFLATIPVSAPLSMMGMEPKLEDPLIAGLMVLMTAGVVYGVVAGIVWILGKL